MPKQQSAAPASAQSTAVALAEGGPPPSSERQSRLREQELRSHVHYQGFRITDDGREYMLRTTFGEPRLFVMLISHQHFTSGEARFQDAPGLCCAKLARALMEDAGEAGPPDRYLLTVKDLLEYGAANAATTSGRKRRRRDTGAGLEF